MGVIGNIFIKNHIRLLGNIAVLSYMVIILSTWIYTNLTGNVYFSAGEDIRVLAYAEWVLGFIGIGTTLENLNYILRV